MSFIKGYLAVLIILFSFNVYGSDSTWQTDIEKRLMDLEGKTTVTETSNNLPIEASNIKSFLLDGFFLIEANDLPDNGGQANFSTMIFEMLPTVQFSDYWSGLAEVEFSSSSQLQNVDSANRSWLPRSKATELERAWVEYGYYSFAKAKFGYFFAPFGITNLQQEPVLLSIHIPQYLDSEIITRNIGGLNVGGNVSHSVSYDIYTGVGASLDSNIYSSSPFVVGARTAYAFPWQREWAIGLNYQTSTRTGESPFTAFGADILMDWKKFYFIGEEVQDDHGRYGFYLEPSYRLGRHKLYYALDRIRNTSSVDELTRHKLGFNYEVLANIRFKLEVNRTIYMAPRDSNMMLKDYTEFLIQGSFSF